MAQRTIVVLPYDEKWADAFEEIRKELADALGALAERIEHVGSEQSRESNHVFFHRSPSGIFVSGAWF